MGHYFQDFLFGAGHINQIFGEALDGDDLLNAFFVDLGV